MADGITIAQTNQYLTGALGYRNYREEPLDIPALLLKKEGEPPIISFNLNPD